MCINILCENTSVVVDPLGDHLLFATTVHAILRESKIEKLSDEIMARGTFLIVVTKNNLLEYFNLKT